MSICISFIFIGNKDEIIKNNSALRSDLILPTNSVFLDRPELTQDINTKLINQKGIQTIALVGPGGSGKTTLARQYAHQQKENVIWEINAETHESLRASFENLAQALSQTEEDKKELRGLLEIKDPTKREENILQFVKKHLSSTPNWVLIYDNVENFSNIQDYFPQDYVTWGEVDENTFKLLLEKRGKIVGNKPLTENFLKEKTKMGYDEFVKSFYNNKIKLKDVPGFKPFFRLCPPVGGFERNGVKYSFSMGGVLGYRKDKINELLTNNKALFLALDQGLEHGPKDFNLTTINPEYVFNLARDEKFNAIILQKGLAIRYHENYRYKIPLILKLNGKTGLGHREPYSPQICSVKKAVKLGADAVGYTIYFGSPYEPEMFKEFSKIEEEAGRDYCFNEIALATENNRLCNQILDIVKKDSCIMNIAINTDDYSSCDKLSNENLKNSCNLLAQ